MSLSKEDAEKIINDEVKQVKMDIIGMNEEQIKIYLEIRIQKIMNEMKGEEVGEK